MDNKFKDLFYVLCQNNTGDGDDPFMIPSMVTATVEVPDSEKPGQTRTAVLNPMLSEPDFLKRLDDIWDVVEAERVNFGFKDWYGDYRMFSATLREVFYDGQGFLVPYFGAYLNQPPEKQETEKVWVPAIYHPSTGQVLKRHPIEMTDFDKDPVFECFDRMLWENLSTFENVLYAWKKAIGGQINEKFHEINEGGKGMKELAAPFQREIDKLLKQQGN